MTDKDRLSFCLGAAEEYPEGNELDAARAYRDAAKYRRRTEDGTDWIRDLHESERRL